jgi:type IV pilus assembly protein PilC
MSTFEYKAIDSIGKTVSGRIHASNDIDLELRLGRMGLDLIKYKEATLKAGLFGRNKVGRPELITFCFQLEQLFRAGVPILDSLKDLRDSVTNPRFRDVVSSLIEDIEGGKTLSQAMERYPAIFNHVFVNLIRAGEHSGMLAEILHDLTETLKWQDELAASAKKIIMYPAFVATVVVGAVMFLMVYLVPQLVDFLENMGKAIPLHTQILILVSSFISKYWLYMLISPVLLFVFIRYYTRRNAKMRYRVDSLKLRLWPVGPIYQRIVMARFTRNFALLYKADVSVLDGIKIGESLVGNIVIAEALERIRLQVSEGSGLTESFENTGLFPPLVIRMINVGEQSGKLDTALTNVSYFYNRDIKESIERVQSLVEPVLTVFLGVLLGWVMMSVIGPVYDLLGTIAD